MFSFRQASNLPLEQQISHMVPDQLMCLCAFAYLVQWGIPSWPSWYNVCFLLHSLYHLHHYNDSSQRRGCNLAVFRTSLACRWVFVGLGSAPLPLNVDQNKNQDTPHKIQASGFFWRTEISLKPALNIQYRHLGQRMVSISILSYITSADVPKADQLHSWKAPADPMSAVTYPHLSGNWSSLHGEDWWESLLPSRWLRSSQNSDNHKCSGPHLPSGLWTSVNQVFFWVFFFSFLILHHLLFWQFPPIHRENHFCHLKR